MKKNKIALPRAKSDGIDDLAVGIKRDGVDFDSPAGPYPRASA